MSPKKEVKSNILIENARLIFRNFEGRAGKFNPPGIRSFGVLLEDDTAETLQKDGWNVKWLEPREEGDPPQALLNVKVQFPAAGSGGSRPKIVAITSGGRTILDEESVKMLDWAEIESVDLAIRPYNWDVNGKTGVKAYLKTMYVTLVEDEFEAKYNQNYDEEEPPF